MEKVSYFPRIYKLLSTSTKIQEKETEKSTKIGIDRGLPTLLYERKTRVKKEKND